MSDGTNEEKTHGGHLNPEDLVLAVQSQHEHQFEGHLRICPSCRGRLLLAQDLLKTEALEPAPSTPRRQDQEIRRQRLLTRLASAVHAERNPARLEVSFGAQGKLGFNSHGLHVTVEPRRASLRAGAALEGGQLVRFSRQFGGLNVSLQLTRSGVGSAFRLLLRASSKDSDPPRALSATIWSRGREVARNPLRAGSAQFKNMVPGRYDLEICDGSLVLGRVELAVEGVTP